MSLPELLPWFALKLSPDVSRVIQSLGRRAVLERGQTLGSSVFFNRLVYVQEGFLAQGVINPGGSRLFMMTLSGPGMLGATAGLVDSLDNLPRRYWAATHCVVLTLMPEILLRLSEVDDRLNQELSAYAIRHAMCERMGLMVSQASTVEERLGVFIVAMLAAAGRIDLEKISDKGRWVSFNVLPSRKLVTAMLVADEAALKDVIKKWLKEDVLRWEKGAFLVRSDMLLKYRQWMQPFVRMHENMVPMLHESKLFDRLELDLKH